jgi:predicted kinase
MKTLYLLRGLPGSGKSTLAKNIGGVYYEADQYFEKYTDVHLDGYQLQNAHDYCRENVIGAMELGEPNIIISNTLTRKKEVDEYMELGEKYGYRVFSLVVENRHGGINSHGVPDETLEKMKNRFDLKLI